MSIEKMVNIEKKSREVIFEKKNSMKKLSKNNEDTYKYKIELLQNQYEFIKREFRILEKDHFKMKKELDFMQESIRVEVQRKNNEYFR